ncbi:MAG: T9SS type A sorting domain-containing protein [Candidatus Desantisbacteria bacterium]
MNRICALILLLICSANIEAATVRLEPTVISTMNGATFTVDVVIDGANDLMGAEIFVGFDPEKIESETVIKGEMLGRNNATVAFFPTTITGKVGFATSRMGGNPTGITGSGTIAILHFKCIVDDPSSLLSIDSTDLRDDKLQTILVAGTTGTTITTTHGTATALTIEPAWGTVTTGTTITYTATARDTVGNTWSVTADTVFSSEDSTGIFTSGNVYTTGQVGTWMITGIYADLFAFATATVLPDHDPVKSIVINPATITTQIHNQPFSFSITTVDNDNELVPYSGTLVLSNITNSLTPRSIQIKNGVWTGEVTISKPMFNDKITCEIAEINKTSKSNAFDVLIYDKSDEPIEDEGVSLDIKSGSVGNDYCLQIIHNPNSYEINQAIQKTGILSDTLCEIRGTIATTRELISSFHQPGTLSLIYQLENLGNIDVKTLQICRLQNGQWIPVPGKVCPNDNMVIASINAPGIFCVRGVAFGKSPLDVIVYPNPCRGTEMIFRNLPEDGATIEIYDLAGDRVKKISTQRAEERWNVRNDSGQMVDSGVYFYCVIGKKESTRGKVVIIR